MSKSFEWILFYSSSSNCWPKRKKVQHHSGFEPVTLKREKLSFSSSSLYQQSFHATCNVETSISGFVMNHLVWNFVFTQYLGPSAFRKTKVLGCSFKQWEYRGPSFYWSYCSHRTVGGIPLLAGLLEQGSTVSVLVLELCHHVILHLKKHNVKRENLSNEHTSKTV